MTLKVAILGSNGQLGQQLTKTLKFFTETKGFSKKDIDITNSQNVQQILEQFCPEVIINCAAYTNVGEAEIEKELADQINSKAINNLAEFSKNLGAHLIHFSTDYVFSGESNSPYDEDDKTEPIGIYGHTKRAGELNLIGSGCKFTIFRVSGVYSHRKNSFLGKIIENLQKGDNFHVVNDQHTLPTSVKFIADIIKSLLRNNLLNEINGEIIHLAPDGIVSWHDFAQEIRNIYKNKTNAHIPSIKTISSEDLNLSPKRPTFSVLSNKKIKKLLKVNSLESCIEALREYYI